MVYDSEYDRIDEKILRELERDGRLTMTELAARVGLSKTPCQMRVKKLEMRGTIRGYRAIVNPELFGRQHIVFVEVTLSDTREKALQGFNQAVMQIAEVEECHMIAGSFDYLLKVRTKNIEDYRRVMGEQISTLPFVEKTSTNVVMENVKDIEHALVTGD